MASALHSSWTRMHRASVVRPLQIARPASVAATRRPQRGRVVARCHGPEKSSGASEDGALPIERWQPASSTPQLLLTTTLAAGGLLGLFPNLSGPASVAQAIGILCLIVAFHELGHFSAARLQGIHVTKFAVGFGPTLLSFTSGGVEYSLRALPLGGFVAFPDKDDPENEFKADDPDLLENRPVLDRVIVTSAGVIFNMILAFGVLTAQVADVGYATATYEPGVRVPVVLPGYAGERYGLQAGDILLALDDVPLPASSQAVKTTLDTVKRRTDYSIDMTVARAATGKVEHVQVLPDVGPNGNGKIGVVLQNNVREVQRKQAESPVELLRESGKETWRVLSETTRSLVSLFSNFGEQKENLSGPVAVVAVGADIARSGLYTFAAVVNINLAVVNLLPIPALDGFYLLLLLIEAARREKLPDDIVKTFQVSGFLLLVGSGVFLIVRDTLNILPK